MHVDNSLSEPPQSTLSGVARVLVNAGKLPAKSAEDLVRQAREKKAGFVATVVGGSLTPGDDADDARWFNPDQLDTVELTANLLGYLRDAGVAPGFELG